MTLLLLVFIAGAACTAAGFLLASDHARLVARMGFALAIAAALTLAVPAAFLLLIRWDGGLVIAFAGLASAVVGFFAAFQGKGMDRGRAGQGADALRVESALQRLALVAAIVPPQAVVERGRAPLCWTTALPGRPGAVHVTTGLLDRLDDPQLEAVVAHELSHLMHRDATVMTLVAGWPAAYTGWLREAWEHNPRSRIGVYVILAIWLLPLAILQLMAARLMSRQRELVADRAAAHLTGSPAAVASALIELSDGMRETRDRDLRAVRAADVFHFLPTSEPRGFRRVWATHPPLEERLARLDVMERSMQSAPRAGGG